LWLIAGRRFLAGNDAGRRSAEEDEQSRGYV
jgi:hypothetical protein